MEELFCVSPVDGRYRNITRVLSDYFSEYALIKYRVFVEIKWFLKLNDVLGFGLSFDEVQKVNDIFDGFDADEALVVKNIEAETKHDVKAVEYYLRRKFFEAGLAEYDNFIHFGCTSEDINNLAYGVMIKGCLKEVLLPSFEELVSKVSEGADDYRDVPMLGHTHGQPATPTTVGKELAVFVYRWKSVLKFLKDINVRGKFSGAVGCFNSFVVAYPEIDWLLVAKEFVESFEIEFNPLTTQIESHDMICLIFNYIRAFNNITMDFNSDMWIYISNNYFSQAVVKDEVGSSVMPHKVNPINHENSMANIRIANSVLGSLADNLPVSRMQRDLSDSSMLRNIGVCFAHTLISAQQSLIGFGKMSPNVDVLRDDLEKNYMVLAEAVQTVLRKNGVSDAYEKLKELTRGKDVLASDIYEFVEGLNLPDGDKKRLLELRPDSYIGIADRLVDYMND